MNKKKEIVNAVKGNPKLTIKKLANRFDTTPNYVRHCLSIENVSLTNLRENKEKRKLTKINVKKSLVSKIKGKILEVELNWLENNDRFILDLIIEKHFGIEHGIETGEITKDDIKNFKEKVDKVSYIFTEEGIQYWIIFNDKSKEKLFEDIYEGIDWEILLPYMIELDLI